MLRHFPRNDYKSFVLSNRVLGPKSSAEVGFNYNQLVRNVDKMTRHLCYKCSQRLFETAVCSSARCALNILHDVVPTGTM